ncbi:hypothetical protein [Maritalea mediterranea]|uniref:Uncharacterized protein n=1 Tax=Maritalea mediterranea TaxID=2909667 RepID=A0ABS9E5Z1_9HYPH|nr:hypothetical protein [Maritalea mediterranea]MCF4097674.1 hypothetical protein [Maritalea mediterranea]
MKKFILPVAFFAMFGTTGALASCPSPEYQPTNDGVCFFDVFCFLGRSGDLDIRDGVKLQQCQLDKINDVPAKKEEDECIIIVDDLRTLADPFRAFKPGPCYFT